MSYFWFKPHYTYWHYSYLIILHWPYTFASWFYKLVHKIHDSVHFCHPNINKKSLSNCQRGFGNHYSKLQSLYSIIFSKLWNKNFKLLKTLRNEVTVLINKNFLLVLWKSQISVRKPLFLSKAYHLLSVE